MKKLKIISFVIVLIIVFVEIGLRVFAYKKLRKFEHLEYVANKELGYTYKPNSEGIVVTAAYKNAMKINSIGYCWDEFEETKKKHMYRIIIIGDSDDTGIYTNGPNSYVRLLQEKFLNNRDKIEIINFSMDGSERVFDRSNLAINCIKYQPDLILFNTDFPITLQKRYRTTYKGYQLKYTDFDNKLTGVKKYIDNELKDNSIFNSVYGVSYIFRYLCKFHVENPKNIINKFISKNIIGKYPYIKYYIRRQIDVSEIFLKYENTLKGINDNVVKDNSDSNDNNPYIAKKRLSETESIAMYKSLSDSLSKSKVALLLYNKYQQEKSFEALSRIRELNYMPLNIKYRSEYGFGKADDHSSQLGHEVIAKEFYNKLYSSGYIPRKFYGSSKE
ncbi:hypothetical protein [Flavobacterium undicola]|uniref:hypothetical protein n=1 Tax=Flavobacterium undicola TaxID=1932779 RepID=UPI0013768518|nr:hypothetical protein [Flavobacterium undicola]MBA0882498.1 hypothetical protein [Flavobacterium undicola]